MYEAYRQTDRPLHIRKRGKGVYGLIQYSVSHSLMVGHKMPINIDPQVKQILYERKHRFNTGVTAFVVIVTIDLLYLHDNIVGCCVFS